MTSQSGFTLIEALTTGLISTFVGGAALTVLYMTTHQTRDGSANSRLVVQQMVASEQIRAKARVAFGVKLPGDPAGPLVYPAGEPAYVNRSEVILCDAAGNTLGAFRIGPGSDTLWEWTTKGGITAYYPFTIGSEKVTIKESESSFGILAGRRGLTYRLRYTRKESDSTYTLPLITETIQCRNQVR